MSSHAEKIFIDLQQGLMRSWAKKRGHARRTGSQIAEQLTRETGVEVKFVGGQYRVWHPREGYSNWFKTLRQAEEIAKSWSQYTND